LDNLRGNHKSARSSTLLPSNFSAADPTRISPFGDEVAADISQPGGAEFSGQRAEAPGLWASGNFGSGSAGLDNYIKKSIISAKIFWLRVCSVCHQRGAFGVSIG
jgi:hypothetical protein